MHLYDAHETAFAGPYGNHEYIRMDMGLRNAPATSRKLLDKVTSGVQGVELFVYLDDLIIFPANLLEHGRKIALEVYKKI